MVAAVGLPDGSAGTRPVPLGEGDDAGYALRSGEPAIVEDLATETRFQPSPALLELGVVSSLSVPIEDPGQAFGALHVAAREARGSPRTEVTFLTAVATLVVIALERHREEQLTRHASLHDPLTGLPNRTLALDRLAHPGQGARPRRLRAVRRGYARDA